MLSNSTSEKSGESRINITRDVVGFSFSALVFSHYILDRYYNLANTYDYPHISVNDLKKIK